MSRPKGMPRKEWEALSNKKKARFLNFNFQTANTNSGTQQYGAGQTMKPRKANQPGRVRGMNTTFGSANLGDTFGGKRSLSALSDGSAGVVRENHKALEKIVLTGSELIFTVNGSPSFASDSYQVQPGLTAMFPWLSKIAVLYQKYRFRKLRFEYRPLVGVFDNAAVAGRIGMALDLDALADDLVSVEQANLLDPNVSGLLTQVIDMDMDTKAAGYRYVRSGLTPPGSDIKSYDAAKLFLFRYATVNTDIVGELHVTYEVELMGPILSVVGAPVANHHVVTKTNILTAVASGASVIAPLDVPALTGFPMDADTPGVFTLHPGVYRAVWACKVNASGGGVVQAEISFAINGVLPATWPVSHEGDGSTQMGAVYSMMLSQTFRLDSTSTFSCKRQFTLNSGTLVVSDNLSVEVIEA